MGFFFRNDYIIVISKNDPIQKFMLLHLFFKLKLKNFQKSLKIILSKFNLA